MLKGFSVQQVLGGVGPANSILYLNASGAPTGSSNLTFNGSVLGLTGRQTITNASGGTTASNYLQIVGTTSDNSNYPGLELRGGTFADTFPQIVLQNAGLALELRSGYHTTNYPARATLGLNNGNVNLMTSTTGAVTTRAQVKSTGQVRFVPLAANPSGAESGDVYYNSGDNKLKVYNGTSWVDLH